MPRRLILSAFAGVLVLPLLSLGEGPAPPADWVVRFTDITKAAGIRFRSVSDPDKKYIVESMGGGVALFDFDNDGDLDIYFTNSLTVAMARQGKTSRSALYRNNGDGTFADATKASGLAEPGWAMGVAAGDYDGDGWVDLYVTALGSNRLYRNNGNGGFTDVAGRAGSDDERWSAGATFGDYDRDGDLDLFVANYVDFRLSDLPEFGKGKFCQYRGVAVQCGPRGLPGAGDALFRNNGDGTFTNISEQAGISDPRGRYGLTAVFTDLDQDGWLDLFVANDTGPNFLYKNNRDGTFAETGYLAGVAVGEDGGELGDMGAAIGDFDHSGKFSIFVTTFEDQYKPLYRQEAPLTFTEISYLARLAHANQPYVGWGTEFVDFDHDGWLDLLILNGHVYPQMENIEGGAGYAQPKLLFRNNRDGTFSEVTAHAGDALLRREVSRGAAFGDLDNDGDVDVVINNLDGAPLVLRNDGGNRRNWITIKTQGSRMNPQGLGALARVVAGDLVQIAEVRSGGSYISQSDTRLHFGLGERKSVDQIEIRWMDGSSDRIKDVRANQCVVIQQGNGLLGPCHPQTPR